MKQILGDGAVEETALSAELRAEPAWTDKEQLEQAKEECTVAGRLPHRAPRFFHLDKWAFDTRHKVIWGSCKLQTIPLAARQRTMAAAGTHVVQQLHTLCDR